MFLKFQYAALPELRFHGGIQYSINISPLRGSVENDIKCHRVQIQPASKSLPRICVERYVNSSELKFM